MTIDTMTTIPPRDSTEVQELSVTSTIVAPPNRYYVFMHNDDVTPFDFVIEVLVGLYRHDEQTAADLANKIHLEEKAIVGMYNLEIAEQKVEETLRASKASGFPLTVSIVSAD